MDSSNRRIDAPIPTGAKREWIIENARQIFHNSETIASSSPYISIGECTRNFPMLYYSENPQTANQCLTNVGTIHQFLSLSRVFENIYNLMGLLDSESEDTGKTDQLKRKAIIDEGVETLVKHASELKWASVRESPIHSANSPDFSRTNHESIYGSRVTKILNGMMSSECHDYRALALKVDLYDDLRETRFSQPSGVDYAWATTNHPEKNIVTLNRLNLWHYEAIFVSLDVIEIAIQNDWKLQIGGGDFWDLRSHLVKMIPLNCCRGLQLMDIGHIVWILSHLKYPLAWVIDHYEMVLVGSKDEKRKEGFVRTAGLVDIPNTTEKIVFVITSKQNVIVDSDTELDEVYTRDKRKIVDFGNDYFAEVYTRDVNRSVSLGHKIYEVYGTDEHGTIPRDRKIQIHNFDEDIAELLRYGLTWNYSLRDAFTEYTQSYFPSGINWLEINSLTTTLIVRWHQKIECYKKNKEAPTFAVGAPASVLKAMGLTPDPEITDESYPAYGGTEAVNSLDQRYVDREFLHPFISIGEWGHFASLMVTTGFAVYNTHNVEDPERVTARCRASGLDRLYRAPFLRIAFEQWKRSLGLTDGIAFHNFNSELLQHSWEHLRVGICCTDDNKPQNMSTICSFAKYFVNKNVAWFWTMNNPTTISKISKGGTLTGIRTVSSWWRGEENTKWLPFTMERPKGPCDDAYYYNDTLPHWTSGCYEKYGEIPDYPEMERVLMRLNLNATDRDWGLTYKDHLNPLETSGISWVVDSSHGGVLADSMGWFKTECRFPTEVLWGWGIAVWLKNEKFEFKNKRAIKTLVIPYKTAGIAIGNYFRKGTILFAEEAECEIIGLNRYYMNRPMGLDPNVFDRARKLKCLN